MPLQHTQACRNQWSMEIQICICGMEKANRALADRERELERLRREVQDAFDKGYRAAGGEITPIIRTKS